MCRKNALKVYNGNIEWFTGNWIYLFWFTFFKSAEHIFFQFQKNKQFIELDKCIFIKYFSLQFLIKMLLNGQIHF